MTSTDVAPVGGGSDDLGPEDDPLELLRAVGGERLATVLDGYRFVGRPLAADGATFAGLICGREHLDEFEPGAVRGGGMLLIRMAPSDAPGDPMILGRLQTTQESLTLADLVEHALDHEREAHDDA